MIKSPVILAIILLVATLVAVGYQAYELNKIRLGKKNAVNTAEQITHQVPATLVERVPTLAQLAKENLMGNPVKIIPKEKQAVITATALKLVLVGTIVKTNSGQSSALIQGGNREAKRYFVGEMVEAGVFLDGVAVDSVMLKRNGQLERLGYPESTVQSSSTVMPTPQPIINLPQENNKATEGVSKKVMSLRERLKQNNRMQQAPKDPSRGAN